MIILHLREGIPGNKSGNGFNSPGKRGVEGLHKGSGNGKTEGEVDLRTICRAVKFQTD